MIFDRPQMKPRVILDIAALGHGFDLKSARRGVERTVEHLFEGLLKSDFCDLSFTATSFLAGTHDFLAAKGIEPQEKLKYVPQQLSRSRAARRLVQKIHRNRDDRRLSARASRKIQSLAAHWLTRSETEIEPGFLSDADIYHTPHTSHPLPPFPSAVQKKQRIRKFITIHDLMVFKHPEIFGAGVQPYFKKMLACFSEKTFAFCTTENVRADILELTPLQPERIFLAPLAADLDLFYPASAAAIRAARGEFGIPDAPYFLALSVPEPHKNFGHLIRCFGELVQSGELPDYNLVIAGRNAARHPLVADALAKFPRLAGRVLTPGFVPDEKLAAIYSGATAFLFPSLAEGFGLPPLEAMQCGVPVISSNTTSMPEVVGDAGILLPPTDVDGWCAAMLKISRDEKLRSEMAAKSIARAKLFSWERFIDATVHGYRTSLEFKD
jgi:glycosyltransferase involved in cell wall biosynthesis